RIDSQEGLVARGPAQERVTEEAVRIEVREREVARDARAPEPDRGEDPGGREGGRGERPESSPGRRWRWAQAVPGAERVVAPAGGANSSAGLLNGYSSVRIQT